MAEKLCAGPLCSLVAILLSKSWGCWDHIRFTQSSLVTTLTGDFWFLCSGSPFEDVLTPKGLFLLDKMFLVHPLLYSAVPDSPSSTPTVPQLQVRLEGLDALIISCLCSGSEAHRMVMYLEGISKDHLIYPPC